MFSAMLMFEWRYFTRQPSFFVTGILFFSLAFMAPSTGMSFAGNVMKNGPYLTTFLMLFLGMFSLFLVVNFITDTALRDHSHFSTEIIYTKPIQPSSYHLGKFFGSFTVIAVIFSLVPIGLMLGSLMPWVDATRMGAVDPIMYLVSFTYFSLPTLFVFSCLFYTLAVRFRSLTGVYLAAVGLLIFNEISESLFAAA
jgi:ABC-2 type transport system permease protein